MKKTVLREYARLIAQVGANVQKGQDVIIYAGLDQPEFVQTVTEVLESHPKALKNPECFVRLSAHNDSALTYTARVWCKTADYWDVNFDVIESVKKAFDANSIQIPYNQIDVHVDNK